MPARASFHARRCRVRLAEQEIQGLEEFVHGVFQHQVEMQVDFAALPVLADHGVVKVNLARR